MLVDIPVDIKRSNALVIGNGKSRLQFDLHELNAIYVTYGCNALYREFIPDHLISVDKHMINEILEKRVYMHKTQIHIQGHSDYDNHELKDHYKIVHYGMKEGIDSGNTALLVACQQGHLTIYMIGFDYDIYNVYSNTRNYNDIAHHSLPPKWQTTITKIIDRYKDVQFIRVNSNGVIPNIDKKNYTNITVEQFKEIYKNEL